MTTRGSESGLTSLLELRSRRTTDPELQKPAHKIDTLSTAEFWKIVEVAFIRTRNITFAHHVFLITKQLRGETVEHFYGEF